METKFLDNPIVLKDIPKECPVDPFLLENNEKQISQMCDFLQGDKKLLLVNGFRGSGKTKIVNFVSDSVNPDVLVLNYTCFETTILDDMLLSFFESFKMYTMMGKITPAKTKVENFNQKINSYFNTITLPILVVIDSFQSVMKENRSAIIDFIKHLSGFKNIKIVLVSKAVASEDFSDIEHENITILALSQKVFEKMLRENGIKQIGVLSNEFYKQSKGYYGTVILAINIMNLRNLGLVKFLEQFSKSYIPFPEFVIREALELVDPVSVHLFRLLTVMRIPIHINLLKSLNLYEEEKAIFFAHNSILSTNGQCLYLKDYFRDIIENQIPDNVRIKLHSACVDLYNTQLPLKPLERDLMLSRQTMRNEIEYHSMFIPKKPALNQVKEIPVEPMITPTDIVTTGQTEKEPQKEETKEEKLKKISFIVEDENVMNNIADSIKDFITTSIKDNELEVASQSMSLAQVMNAAKNEENNYNYKRVIMLYKQALTKTTDDDFYTFLPTIYYKMAKAYQNLSSWYEALEYYTQAQDFYVNTSNPVKVAEMKLEIANIYYIMYKIDNARFILNELEKEENLPNELKIKIYMTGARLSNSSSIEYKYYKKALPLVDVGTDKAIVSELYYKYAVASDEADDPKTAAIYYKKCIDLDSSPKNNPYISMSLANLAELYDEAGATQFAIKYYTESIELDKAANNYNGMYYSSIHLGEIYAAKNDTLALEHLNNALECANTLNEPFYIAGASIEIGEFHLKRRNFEEAYKMFINAYKIAEKSFTKDNLDKIKSRLNDVKHRVSEEIFAQLQEKYGK
jgi:tetratricopeptide (TPR) repeat protein